MQTNFSRPQQPPSNFGKPILFFAVLGLASLLFTLASVTLIGRRYQDMRQYMQDMPCARPNDPESSRPPCQPPTQAMTVVAANSYVETHHRRGGDTSETLYALQLRDASGGTVTERGINERVGRAATVGRTVTAEFWRGRLTDIDIDGHSSTTSDSPIASFFNACFPTIGGFFVTMACFYVVSALRGGRRRRIV